MDQDFINKLINMISSTYDVIVSFFDVNGMLISNSNELQGEYLEYYLNSTKHMKNYYLQDKTIQVSVNEASLTQIGIPVFYNEILVGYLIIGPFFCYRLSEKIMMEKIENMITREVEKKICIDYFHQIPCYQYVEYIKIIKLSHIYLYGRELDETSIKMINRYSIDDKFSLEDETNNNFEISEHGTYLFERHLWEYIRNGDVDRLKELLKNQVIQAKAGMLCTTSELRNLKNLCIIGTALASRAAMEGGLNAEIAYSLSDIYIQQIEACKQKIPSNMTHDMFFDYARRVQELNKITNYSPPVNQCCEYIKAHVYDNISVAHIAEDIGISYTYLSHIFRQETKLSIMEYIKKMKIKEAKFLLKYTNLSLIEISEKLSFSSQSHFIKVFREVMSITPKFYRDKVRINK